MTSAFQPSLTATSPAQVYYAIEKENVYKIMADGLLNSVTHRSNLILHCRVLVIVSGFFYGKIFLNLF